MLSRLQRLRSQFASLKVDAFLVTFEPHLRYLSGFSGSAGAGIVTADSSILVTDGRYASQVKDEVEKRWRVYITSVSLLDEIRRKKLLPAGMRVGFDGNTLVLSQLRQLKKLFPK